MRYQLPGLCGLLILFVLARPSAFAQNNGNTPDYGQIQGNVQVLFQQYNEDSTIASIVPPEQTTLNAFTNLIYTRGPLSAGIRYESYLPRQAGYPDKFNGSGLGYRFASYAKDELSLTVGNFYEQFGTGIIMRAYEERNLGLDNAMDGVKVGLNPLKGVYLKGVYGKMRFNFNDGLVNTEGYVRGVDAEVSLNEAFAAMDTLKTRIILGGSFVSKYQRDNRSDLVLPENVGAWAARANLFRGGFSFLAEYAYKINDPSADNGFIYKDGQALILNAVYATKGFSVALNAKSIDNMSFRPDRNLQITDATINYLPAMTTQHTDILAATFYPYASQFNGEVAYQAEVGYKIPKDSWLGGKSGMDVYLSVAQAYQPDTVRITGDDPQLTGHSTNFLSAGDRIYFSDFNAQIKKKFSKNLRGQFTYYNFVYNNDVITGARQLDGTEVKGSIYADVFVAELNIKTKPKHNLKVIAQYLSTDQHQGDWAGLVLEYSVSPNWVFAVLDLYNFGNEIVEDRVHYPFGSITHIKGANRIAVEYGRRRAGIFCVGGVCRAVPASNGLTVTITSSF